MKLLKQKVTFFFTACMMLMIAPLYSATDSTITQLNVNTGSHPAVTQGPPANYYQEQEFMQIVNFSGNGDNFMAAVNSPSTCTKLYITLGNSLSYILVPYTGYYHIKAHFDFYNNHGANSYPVIMIVTYDPPMQHYAIQAYQEEGIVGGNGARAAFEIDAPNTVNAITQDTAYTGSTHLMAPTGGANQQFNNVGTENQEATGGVFLVAGSRVQPQMTDGGCPGNPQAYVLVSGSISIAASSWGNSGTQ